MCNLKFNKKGTLYPLAACVQLMSGQPYREREGGGRERQGKRKREGKRERDRERKRWLEGSAAVSTQLHALTYLHTHIQMLNVLGEAVEHTQLFWWLR